MAESVFGPLDEYPADHQQGNGQGNGQDALPTDDVWTPPEDPLSASFPQHPNCRSVPLSHRWWQDALDAALEASRRARQDGRQDGRPSEPAGYPDDMARPLTPPPPPTPITSAAKLPGVDAHIGPGPGRKRCAYCCEEGVQRPEALRLVYRDTILTVVNGAPYRYEVSRDVPCCLVCWQRLCFAQYLVQIGALSDWYGGVRHDIKAVMPPVTESTDLSDLSERDGPSPHESEPPRW